MVGGIFHFESNLLSWLNNELKFSTKIWQCFVLFCRFILSRILESSNAFSLKGWHLSPSSKLALPTTTSVSSLVRPWLWWRLYTTYVRITLSLSFSRFKMFNESILPLNFTAGHLILNLENPQWLEDLNSALRIYVNTALCTIGVLFNLLSIGALFNKKIGFKRSLQHLFLLLNISDSWVKK